MTVPAFTSAFLERAAKIVLFASTLLGIALQVTIVYRYWTPIAWLTAATLLTSASLTRKSPRAAAACLAGITFLAPALLLVWIGTWPAYYCLWHAALVGMMLASPGATGWSLPSAWRAPVACWGLVIAMSWPIVVGRELEWNPDFLYRVAMRVTGSGMLARDAADLVVFVALTHTVGLLWLDWLFSIYASERQFRRMVIVPLIFSWTAAALVGLYQMAVDLSLFSPGFWVVLKRATGPIRDANGFGMICAMWGPIFAALALTSLRRLRTVAAVAVFALSFAGVWASGSRTAFLLVAVGCAAFLWTAARTPSLSDLRLRIATGMALAAALAVLAVLALDLPVVGPLSRALALVPNRTVGEFLMLFWDRDGYGSAAVEAIERAPLAGVGIGSFYFLVGDIWHSAGHYRLPLDNAQSWYRHELAEFGLLGSLGWILWLAMVVRSLLRPIPDRDDALVIDVSRAVLILLGIIQLVGIPTQVFPVAISFLTILAWHMCARADSAGSSAMSSGLGLWALVWAVAFAHAGITLAAARGEWRVPNRAVWATFKYEQGLYRDAPEYFWTAKRGVLVQPAQSGRLKLTVWTSNPDADREPIEVDVWVDERRVIDRKLPRDVAVTEQVRLPGPGKWFVLETRVDRTFRPSDFGASPDRRDLGLAVALEFLPDAEK